MTLRLLEELKKNGIKQPAGIKIDANAGMGFKEEKPSMMMSGYNENSANMDLQDELGDKNLG